MSISRYVMLVVASDKREAVEPALKIKVGFKKLEVIWKDFSNNQSFFH